MLTNLRAIVRMMRLNYVFFSEDLFLRFLIPGALVGIGIYEFFQSQNAWMKYGVLALGVMSVMAMGVGLYQTYKGYLTAETVWFHGSFGHRIYYRLRH